ncbi:hypothetical protein KI387_035724, partial [Taxus chinensis]
MAANNIPLYSTFWLGNLNFCRKPCLHFSSKATVYSGFSSFKIACKIEVDTEKFKRRLIKKGFMPTPKVIHKLKKKEIQKIKRKAKKNTENEPPPRVKKIMEEEALFEKACREYEMLMAELEDREEGFSASDGKSTEDEFSAGVGKFAEENYSVSDGNFTEEDFLSSDRKFIEEEFSVSEKIFTEDEFSVSERKSTEEDFSARERKFTERISVRSDEGEEIPANDIKVREEFSVTDDDDGELGDTEEFSVSERKYNEEICVGGADNEDYGIFVSDEKVTEAISDDDRYDNNVGKMAGNLWEKAGAIERSKGSNSGVGNLMYERHGRKKANYRDERIKGSVTDGTFMKEISVADDDNGNNGVKMEGKILEMAGDIENNKGLNSGVGNFRSARYGRPRAGYTDEKVKGFVSGRKTTDEIAFTDDDSDDGNKSVIIEGKPWERARGIETREGFHSGLGNLRSERHGKLRASHSDGRGKGFVSGRKFAEEVPVTDVEGDNDHFKGVTMKGKPWERARAMEKRKGSSSGVSNFRSVRQGGMRASYSDIDKRVKGQGGMRASYSNIDETVKGKGEDLGVFREMLVKRGKGDLKDLNWLLDDDLGDDDFHSGNTKGSDWEAGERPRGPIDEDKQIRWLTERLNSVNVKMPAWQLSNLMHSARMKFTDGRLVKIVQVLGDLGNWRKAVEVVHWVHNRKRYMYCKGRYTYTTLLAVLGKAKRPIEALNVFHAMREHISSYPDMPAYRCIATILGQSGYLKELLNIINCLRIGPANLMKNVKFLHWDPRLEPDVVVYNAVLNACVPWKQWEGAFWVLQEMRQNGMRPSSATYGLAIEVMLASGKYEMVHNLFEKMGKAGLMPNALTYKAIVRAFWKEKKIDEAVRAVEEMKYRGVVPTASVYYELASGLCSAGRWPDAQFQ